MGRLQANSIFLEGGERAVLLLHSFTSTSKDVKKLSHFLNTKNYTCFAPTYEGHGLTAEALLRTDPNDWWESVRESYLFLKKKGYENVSVIGISLGGVLSLQLSQKLAVNGAFIMSAPYKREVDALKNHVLNYATSYKKAEGKTEAQITEELTPIKTASYNSLTYFKEYISLTMMGLSQIDVPIKILYGELDEDLYRKSAEYIYQNVSSEEKSMRGCPNSKHFMLNGEDQEEIYADIFAFLESLKW